MTILERDMFYLENYKKLISLNRKSVYGYTFEFKEYINMASLSLNKEIINPTFVITAKNSERKYVDSSYQLEMKCSESNVTFTTTIKIIKRGNFTYSELHDKLDLNLLIKQLFILKIFEDILDNDTIEDSSSFSKTKHYTGPSIDTIQHLFKNTLNKNFSITQLINIFHSYNIYLYKPT